MVLEVASDLHAIGLAGGDEAGAVPVAGHRVLHLGADGVEVPRHPGAAGARAARLRAPPAPRARPPRYAHTTITPTHHFQNKTHSRTQLAK